jgi:hypothetical protein
VADESAVAVEGLLELVLGAIDMAELDDDIEPPACWDEFDDEPLLDVHAVVARASATTALPMVMRVLRKDMSSPAERILWACT